MKNGVFWDVTPYGCCKSRRFGGMSILTRSTRRNMPEDAILKYQICMISGCILAHLNISTSCQIFTIFEFLIINNNNNDLGENISDIQFRILKLRTPQEFRKI
jgi:hypothetical protein